MSACLTKWHCWLRPPTPIPRRGARLRVMAPLFLTTLMLVQTFAYPSTRKGDVVDDHHGTKVADPYRWLEDVDSPETRTWVDAENRVTFAYLEQIPERERIRRRLTELWDYPKRSEEHTSELQSRLHLVCRLLLEKKKTSEAVI